MALRRRKPLKLHLCEYDLKDVEKISPVRLAFASESPKFFQCANDPESRVTQFNQIASCCSSNHECRFAFGAFDFSTNCIPSCRTRRRYLLGLGLGPRGSPVALDRARFVVRQVVRRGARFLHVSELRNTLSSISDSYTGAALIAVRFV